MKILLNKVIILNILILFILFFIFNIEDINFSYYQILLLNLYGCIFILSLKKNYTIITLFLIALFVFQYGRVVLIPLLFKEKSINISWFHYYMFSKETIIFIYELLFYNLIGIFLGISLFKEKNQYTEARIPVFLLKMKKVIIVILFFSFIFFCINNINYIKSLYLEGNYIDIYLGKNFVNSNFFIRIVGAIFYPLLIISMAIYRKDKKVKYLIYSLFLIANFIFSLKGSRSYFVNALFVIIFLTLKKIDIKKIFLITLISITLIYFSQIMNNIREKDDFNFNTHKIFKEFIIQQGITGTFLGLLNDKPELFERKIPYIFSSIIGKKIKSQKEEKINILDAGNIELCHQLSARSNYKMYTQGYGMGGNYIIEMYDFLGKYGIVFLSFLHTYFSLYFFMNIKKFIFWKQILLILILDGYFLIPRGTYFPFIHRVRLSYIFIIYIIFKISYKFLKQRGNNEKYIICD